MIHNGTKIIMSNMHETKRERDWSFNENTDFMCSNGEESGTFQVRKKMSKET